jgi:bifunctional non-homologous end joining protein LigD
LDTSGVIRRQENESMIDPMLLHHAEPDFVLDDSWLLEIKYDGVRAIYDTRGDVPILYTRKGHVITEQFPEVNAPEGLLLDGEIVGFDRDGFHKLNWVQRRLGVKGRDKIIERMRRFPITFVVFDYLNDLSLDYEKRMSELKHWENDLIVSETYPASDIDKMWAFVRKNNLEGLVAKKKKSQYVQGLRTYEWRKIKHDKPKYRKNK